VPDLQSGSSTHRVQHVDKIHEFHLHDDDPLDFCGEAGVFGSKFCSDKKIIAFGGSPTGVFASKFCGDPPRGIKIASERSPTAVIVNKF